MLQWIIAFTQGRELVCQKQIGHVWIKYWMVQSELCLWCTTERYLEKQPRENWVWSNLWSTACNGCNEIQMVKERIKQHRCMGEFIYLKVSAAVGKRGVIPIWESCRCCLQRDALLGCWRRRRRMPVEGWACANGPAEGQAASVAVTGRGRPWGEGSAQRASPSW